jgi:hypothetical protein
MSTMLATQQADRGTPGMPTINLNSGATAPVINEVDLADLSVAVRRVVPGTIGKDRVRRLTGLSLSDD